MQNLQVVIIILLAIFWIAPDGVSAKDRESVFDRGCGDDKGVDRCDPKIRAKMLDSYDWEPAATLVAKGVTFRRMMFVDGYGNDVVGISFYREPGRSPKVRVDLPRFKDGEKHQELVASLANNTWKQVIADSAQFDEILASEMTTDTDTKIIHMCLHGWFVVAEAGDAIRMQQNVIAQRESKTSIRRDSEGSCADGLTVPYAFRMAQRTQELLPECHSLDPAYTRNMPLLLAYCARLGGDRIAASEAMKTVKKLESRFPIRSLKEVRWLMSQTAHDQAPEFAEILANSYLYLGLPTARDIDHARVNGSVHKREKSKAKENSVADISIELVRQSGDFVVLSYNLSEWRNID